MWKFGSEGIEINNTFGVHIGMVGIEVYQRTNDFGGYINAYPNSRMNSYEKNGFIVPWR